MVSAPVNLKAAEKWSSATARKFLSRFPDVPAPKPVEDPVPTRVREPLELPVVALQIENNLGLTFDRQMDPVSRRPKTKP
jgi:hypothetical protein